MLCEPAPSEEVVKVACLEALSVPVPSVVAPSLKVTVPWQSFPHRPYQALQGTSYFLDG